MTRLEEYNAEKTPTMTSPMGTLNVCEAAARLKAYDTSGAKSTVNSGFEELINSIRDGMNEISSQLESLEDAWGVNFISINGSSMGLVHPEQFMEYLDSAISGAESMQEQCLSFCNSIESSTQYINEQLDALVRSTELYNTAKAEAEAKGETLAMNPTILTASDLMGQWIVQ